jgi:hypothetical protein
MPQDGIHTGPNACAVHFRHIGDGRCMLLRLHVPATFWRAACVSCLALVAGWSGSMLLAGVADVCSARARLGSVLIPMLCVMVYS